MFDLVLVGSWQGPAWMEEEEEAPLHLYRSQKLHLVVLFTPDNDLLL